MIYLTKSPLQTGALGKKMAKDFLKKKTRIALGLTGNLGGGKTTFLKGFAEGLGIKERITSPTFLIMKSFKIPKHKRLNPRGFAYFFHFDCYRVRKAEDVLNLGFREIISDPKNIVAVEWPDKIKKIMPSEAVFVNFYFEDKKKRKIFINMVE